MLRKSFENIDQRANIPEGIEFRKELIWENIQKSSSKKRSWRWIWLAASLFPLLLLGIWMVIPSQKIETNYLLSRVMPENYMEVPVYKPTFKEKKQGEISIVAKITLKDSIHIRENNPVALDSSEAIQSKENSTTSRPSIVFEYSSNEPEVKKLSPAAEALKNALAKTKVEGKTEERIVVEKLTFEQQIQARKHYQQENASKHKTKQSDEN
ncbi:hypothetical protein [Shivajiella indica]|uniref:Uncharacterized protein n=1 Tax=Shivajiella indica TaxID=872115 RepID=A0ABW5B6A4_9BACT